MTDETQDASAMSFEELLACPHLQFDLGGELLPHLLAFSPSLPGPSAAASRAPRRRPWVYEPSLGATTTASATA